MQGYCPKTNTKGKQVDGATVKAMLSVSLRHVHDTPYYFCREPDCDVVYFSEDGGQLFFTSDIRERVYQKDPNNPSVLVCYCFSHTLGDLHRQIQESKTGIIDDINAGIHKGQCACDWRNPQGDCCLGNVYKIVKDVREPGL